MNELPFKTTLGLRKPEYTQPVLFDYVRHGRLDGAKQYYIENVLARPEDTLQQWALVQYLVKKQLESDPTSVCIDGITAKLPLSQRFSFEVGWPLEEPKVPEEDFDAYQRIKEQVFRDMYVQHGKVADLQPRIHGNTGMVRTELPTMPPQQFAQLKWLLNKLLALYDNSEFSPEHYDALTRALEFLNR